MARLAYGLDLEFEPAENCCMAACKNFVLSGLSRDLRALISGNGLVMVHVIKIKRFLRLHVS